MSDPGRKDFSTKAKEEITPDSSKSTLEKTKETFTDTADRAVRGGQTDDSKSTGQAMFDKTQRTSDREVHGGTGESLLDKAKSAVGMGNNNNPS